MSTETDTASQRTAQPFRPRGWVLALACWPRWPWRP